MAGAQQKLFLTITGHNSSSTLDIFWTGPAFYVLFLTIYQSMLQSNMARAQQKLFLTLTGHNSGRTLDTFWTGPAFVCSF
jgi:hypothetical protein